MKNNKDLENIVDFVYEMGIHRKTPRSGFWFLGSGDQSVAEHLFRCTMIAYALCHLVPKANKEKVLFMALVHDIGEGRTSDLNYAHQRYGRLAEGNAVADIARSIPFGKEIEEAYKEEQGKITLESRLVKDADVLEWMASLREEEVKGNIKARRWITIAQKRLMLPESKNLAKLLIKTHPDRWWFDARDKWFIARKEKDRKWK